MYLCTNIPNIFINTIEFRTILKELQGEQCADEIPSTVLTGRDTEEVVALIEEEESGAELQRWSKDSSHSILIKSSISRFFCGEGRSQSPFGTLLYMYLQSIVCHRAVCNYIVL